jgi:hypothetical protein
VEYWDPTRENGVVFAFRGSVANEPDHAFVLKDLELSQRYRLHFQDQTSPDRVVSGAELEGAGLKLHLPNPQSSELVFIEPDLPLKN